MFDTIDSLYVFVPHSLAERIMHAAGKTRGKANRVSDRQLADKAFIGSVSAARDRGDVCLVLRGREVKRFLHFCTRFGFVLASDVAWGRTMAVAA